MKQLDAHREPAVRAQYRRLRTARGGQGRVERDRAMGAPQPSCAKFDGAGELWARGLVDSELLSAFARLERAGAISAREGTDALGAWSLLRCQRFPSELLLQDAWSRRAALRVSDAQYVALADRLGAPLLTSDARLARAPVGQVEIQLIE